jgi:glycosyltransferase involved in cell wall biosynthesis
MKRIIDVPIEAIPDRYSADWQIWFEREYNRLGVPFIRINPEPLSNKITCGSFLDVAGTNYYKSMQTAMICEMIYNKEITENDVFFFHDLWHPGIESLAYIRDGMGINYKIVGCLHAGSYDPYDFLHKKGMTYWAEDSENSWFKIIDKIFVATKFHKHLILSKRKCNPKKIVVTHWPFYWDKKPIAKENIVIFPHRLDEEKNYPLFLELKEDFEENFEKSSLFGESWSFVATKEVCKTKEEYYDLLGRAKISVSFADQETFGIAMMESLFSDCLILVPDRLSYSELYPSFFKFASFEEACSKLFHFTQMNEGLDILQKTKDKLRMLGETAIERMIKEALHD